MPLSAQQLTAAESPAGTPLLVLAGAGSGKTRCMVHRCLFFVRTKVCVPTQILALTFTRNSADEMKARLASALRLPEARCPKASTFHSLALEICRQSICGPGFTRDFTVWAATEQRDVVVDFVRLDFWVRVGR